MWQIQQHVKEKVFKARSKRIGNLFPKSIVKKQKKKKKKIATKAIMEPFSCGNRMQKHKKKK